ncbi:protein TIFY 4B-like isoform X1 [Cucurbita pepo subsp. pepo]|uniref:protein TIFY 4B-like isoform X1 n=1 Tax=Cucurbita pepo subsp. pepo TaxID=3664 RepID=UPI000C9D43AF|nr:protein TIFY 4B-like isoform X1 [Cucurbita pepo subsp. pepo]
MSAGAATFPSILDKPLNQLTEDDISQLTREDCRKYLKEKGMRRPSWNKSQAIQQVISLKALLEPCDDSGASALRKVVVLPQVNSNQGDSPKEPSDDAQFTMSVDESAYSNVETAKSTPEDPPAEPDNNVTSPRNQYETNGVDGQMTIFYCGKVNVYDGVPPDKAWAIMHLAASPIHVPQNHPLGGTAACQSPPRPLQTCSDKDDFFPPSATMYRNVHTEKMVEHPQQQQHVKGTSTRDSDVEGQASRKVSLQRYLEKRKDRGRLKNKKNPELSSSSLEGYMNHQMRTHISNENLGQFATSSLSPTGVAKAFVGTADNQPKLACFPVDLNVKDIQEC